MKIPGTELNILGLGAKLLSALSQLGGEAPDYEYYGYGGQRALNRQQVQRHVVDYGRCSLENPCKR